MGLGFKPGQDFILGLAVTGYILLQRVHSKLIVD